MKVRELTTCPDCGQEVCTEYVKCDACGKVRAGDPLPGSPWLSMGIERLPDYDRVVRDFCSYLCWHIYCVRPLDGEPGAC